MEFRRLKEEVERIKAGLGGEITFLKAELEKLQGHVAEGLEFRNYLKSEIMRIAGLIGESEFAAQTLERTESVAELRAMLTTYERRWDKACPPRGRADIRFSPDPRALTTPQMDEIAAKLGLTDEQKAAFAAEVGGMGDAS